MNDIKSKDLIKKKYNNNESVIDSKVKIKEKKKDNIESLNIKINFLKKELNIKEQIVSLFKKKILCLKNEIKNLNLRFRAEIENIHKRNLLEIEKIHKYSLEKFAIDLLPIIDNLNNAIKLSIEKNTIYEGIKLTLKSFLFVINKFGINIINKINVPFNPEYHQAMIIKKVDGVVSNTVINVLQDGYIMNGRLLRPAMVEVSKDV